MTGRLDAAPIGPRRARTGPMLLADLVACADAVAATSARTEKIESLAELLRRTDGRDAGVVAGLVAGEGYDTTARRRADPPAAR